VGYGTVINHLAYLFDLFRRLCRRAKKIQPKQIKAQYGATANSELVFADYHWRNRAVDLAAGDILVLPQGAKIEAGGKIELVTDKDNSLVYRAIKPGLARSFCLEREWAVNIRISRKNYEGLAQYRFLEESEVE
jgi:hypothetical protein